MSEVDYSNGCAWVGGEFVPIDQAAIPITDTGFTRSDATYDVAGVWHGRFFRLDDHLARFERGWQRLRMRPPVSRAEVRDIVHECVARSGLRESYVEMIMTRGVPRGGDRDPRNFANRFYAFAIPYVWIAQPDHQLKGLNIVIATSTRRIPDESIDPTVKNFQWGDLTKALFEAYDRDAYTAVLADAGGWITEGPGFNIFGCESGRLITPPNGVLEGVTRDTVMQLARRAGLEVTVERIEAQRLRRCEEVFLTSTAGGVMPVARIDNHPVGSGSPGPVALSLRETYWDAHYLPEWSEPVEYADALLHSAG